MNIPFFDKLKAAAPQIPGVDKPFSPALNLALNPKSSTNPFATRDGFSSGQPPDEQKYNELFHFTEIYLDNSGRFENFNSTEKFRINPAAVMNLSITNNLLNWIVSGTMTILYLPDDSPSGGSLTGQAAVQNGKTLKSYKFRNDGLDLLRVMIVPKDTVANSPGDLQIKSNDPKWILSYLFSIYDTEDVVDIPNLNNANSLYMRCIKLYFRDVRFELLKTTNLEYSTASSPLAIEAPQLANGSGGPRVTTTGQAIREIFEKTLSVKETGGSPNLFAYPGKEKWDDGESLLFYTSPADCSAAEDIDYLLSHHVSLEKLQGAQNANDICLLHTERPKQRDFIEDIHLTPLSWYFKKAGSSSSDPGELQLEHFFVTAQTSETSLPGLYRAPISKGSYGGKDLKTEKYGQIASYAFVDMAPETNNEMFATKPVYSVDIGKRTFNIKFTDNDVLTARRTIAQSYISNLYHNGGDEEKLFLSTLNKRKRSLNVFPVFSLNGDNETVRQRNGLHNLLYTGMFHNACICFKTLGLTLREAGTFIGIDRVGGATDGDYNDKLFGQWFVIRVDHIFEAGAYVNNIYAIKMHRFKEQKTSFAEAI
jgi:hypothetical protein